MLLFSKKFQHLSLGAYEQELKDQVDWTQIPAISLDVCRTLDESPNLWLSFSPSEQWDMGLLGEKDDVVKALGVGAGTKQVLSGDEGGG